MQQFLYFYPLTLPICSQIIELFLGKLFLLKKSENFFGKMQSVKYIDK